MFNQIQNVYKTFGSVRSIMIGKDAFASLVPSDYSAYNTWEGFGPFNLKDIKLEYGNG